MVVGAGVLQCIFTESDTLGMAGFMALSTLYLVSAHGNGLSMITAGLRLLRMLCCNLRLNEPGGNISVELFTWSQPISKDILLIVLAEIHPWLPFSFVGPGICLVRLCRLITACSEMGGYTAD